MTGRLALLRSRLRRLRAARALLRAAAAWMALLISMLIALSSVFLFDLIFQLPALQRLVMLLLAGSGVGWAYWRFTRPLLGIRESTIATALTVERQHEIDSDLVAALQFENPSASGGGSRELAGLVISRVATTTSSIDIFAGLPTQLALRRAGLLAVCLALLSLGATLFPGHLAAFAARLVMRPAHYPTWTSIELINVNRDVVFDSALGHGPPAACRAAESRPLSFEVLCTGQLPTSAAATLVSTGAGQSRTRVPLRALSSADRLLRLREAQALLTDAPSEISPVWRQQLLSLLRADAPAIASSIRAIRSSAELPEIRRELTRAIDRWNGETRRSALYVGELSRLNESVSYQIAAGDAWTEPAVVQMISLPLAAVQFVATPPKYAAANAPKLDPSGRQAAVLEGSSLDLSLHAVNRKPLASASLILQTLNATKRVDLVTSESDRLRWAPPAQEEALRDLHQETRYEIQVVDEDGLSLESPLRGTIRIREDLRPTAAIHVIHRVVLPSAQPVIAYRAGDDFGIEQLTLLVEVERAALIVPTPDGQAPSNPVSAASTDIHRFDLLNSMQPLRGDQLPLSGNFRLSLGPLGLAKGDRLKLALEAKDDRGENSKLERAGIVAFSDSVTIDISDESGVLAAISQPDTRSAEQLSEIIRQELGIGEQTQ